MTVPISAGAEASSPAGAIVTFVPDPSATDIGAVTVSCTLFDDPTVAVVSGDEFPIGGILDATPLPRTVRVAE